MNKNDLKETVNKSIEEMGFARISRAVVTDVFSAGGPVSFDARGRLDEFARENDFVVGEEENFVVFERRAASSAD